MLVNPEVILRKAYDNSYAICHFNINNLEWTKALLETANETKSPIILAVSTGAAKYMGGLRTVVNLVNNLIDNLQIKVPVALHLDHSRDVNFAKQAINLGFTSIMFDGSHLPFEENFELTNELIEYVKKNKKSIALEVELGTIGGQEDEIIGTGEITNISEASKIALLPISMLAIGINNIHGKYPAHWKSLRFDILKEINKVVKKPLVLHGGSGIPEHQIITAIQEGVSKVNINTECQIAFAQAIRNYILQNLDLVKNGYDPRVMLQEGSKAIKKIAKKYFILTKSYGKAFI